MPVHRTPAATPAASYLRDLESLEETLDVLSSPEIMQQLREARAELDRGEGLDEAQLRELLARHGR